VNIADAYRKVADTLHAGLPPQLPVHPGPITRATPIGPCVIVGIPESTRTVGVCSWEFDVPVTIMAGTHDNDWMEPLLGGADHIAQVLIAGGVAVRDVAPDTIDTGGPTPIPTLTLLCSVAG